MGSGDLGIWIHINIGTCMWVVFLRELMDLPWHLYFSGTKDKQYKEQSVLIMLYSLMQWVASSEESQNTMGDRRENNSFHGGDLGCRGRYLQGILDSKWHNRKSGHGLFSASVTYLLCLPWTFKPGVPFLFHRVVVRIAWDNVCRMADLETVNKW